MGARDRLRFAGMANVHAHWDDALLSVAKGDLDPTKAITHRMSLDDAAQGYELFKAREAMKVVLTPKALRSRGTGWPAGGRWR